MTLRQLLNSSFKVNRGQKTAFNMEEVSFAWNNITVSTKEGRRFGLGKKPKAILKGGKNEM